LEALFIYILNILEADIGANYYELRDKMPTLQDLISRNAWLHVDHRLMEIYPDSDADSYEGVFNQLCVKPAKPSKIIITLSVVDEEVNVDGVENGETRALDFTPWSSWLGMEIDKDNLAKFDETDIIVHCLWEMTFIGFDESKIQHELEVMEAVVADIHAGKVTNRPTYKSVKDMLDDIIGNEE